MKNKKGVVNYNKNETKIYELVSRFREWNDLWKKLDAGGNFISPIPIEEFIEQLSTDYKVKRKKVDK